MHSAIPVFDGTYRRMNQQTKIETRHSTCPHDCPSACALDVEVIDGSTIGRVRGSKLQSYTAGVICAKVARYAERIHHPDRLMHPLRRTGAKGSGQFARISWDEALDEIADRFNAAERDFGAQSVWPYYYAGTMGLVMRDGITVNCVVPGLIGTPRPKDMPEPAHHLSHQTIAGERGRPEDVAAAVRFLCSPAARYITGQAIHANGGAYFSA